MFFALFKKLTGINLNTIFIGIFLAVIAAVLIPNYSRVMGFFGYETREVLKDKLNVANSNVEIATNVNKDNVSVIKTQDEVAKSNEEIIVKKFEGEKKTADKVASIKTAKTEKIESIEKLPDTPEEKAKKVSEVQISAIWDTYCSFNTDAQCAANTTPSS